MADPITLIAMTAVAAVSTAVSVKQQNTQIKYQQAVAKQNAIAAQNKAAADMKTRRTEAARVQAAARAKMAASGVSSTTGSFLDLIGQGAAAAEMDVLKAKYEGDVDAWSLNNKINELETQKKNAWLEAGLAGAKTAVSTYSKLYGDGGSLIQDTKDLYNNVSSKFKTTKTSGNSGMWGVDAIEGSIA